MNKSLSRNKFFIVFSILIVLFVAPVFFAHYFYHHRDALPKRTTNRGTLLTPPLTLQQLNVGPAETHGKWVLLFMHPDPCNETCTEQLEVMNRIQRALGKDMNRLQKVSLVYPQTVWMVGDPFGNVILRYRADQNPEDILDDLKHLIKVESLDHGSLS